MSTLLRRDERDTEFHLVRLAEILETEAKLYEEMAELSSMGRSSLVGHDIERLRSAVAQQEELISRIDALEIERRDVVAVVTERLGGRRPLTIGEILALVGDPDRARLRALRERILSEISRIQKINETNAYLIGNSLELVEGELSLFSEGEEVAYDERGDSASRRSRAQLLDRRA